MSSFYNSQWFPQFPTKLIRERSPMCNLSQRLMSTKIGWIGIDKNSLRVQTKISNEEKIKLTKNKQKNKESYLFFSYFVIMKSRILCSSFVSGKILDFPSKRPSHTAWQYCRSKKCIEYSVHTHTKEPRGEPSTYSSCTFMQPPKPTFKGSFPLWSFEWARTGPR